MRRRSRVWASRLAVAHRDLTAGRRSYQGDDEGVLEQMRRGIALAEAMESVAPTWLLLPLAYECLRFGRTQYYVPIWSKKWCNVWKWDNDGRRRRSFAVKGEMLLLAGGLPHRRRGGLLAQGDRRRTSSERELLELRATVSLARLLCDTGQPRRSANDARGHL